MAKKLLCAFLAICLTLTCSAAVFAQTVAIDASNVAGIKSSDYVFDNNARTILVPRYTPVSVFYSKVTLHDGHTGAVVSDGQEVSADSVITKNANLKYRVTYGSDYADYSFITEYADDNFDEFAGVSISNNQTVDGYTVYSNNNATIEGKVEDFNNTMYVHTPAGSSLSMRRLGMKRENIGDKFVFTWDVKTDRTDALNAIILRYQNTSGNAYCYSNLVEFTSSGEIRFEYGSIMNYLPDKWYRITVALDVTGKKGRLYVNGELKSEKSLSMFNDFSHIIEFMMSFAAHASNERNSWMDNFSLYQINSLDDIDEAAMKSEITVDPDIVDEAGNISGYGYINLRQFAEFTSMAEGIQAAIYDKNGNKIGETDAVTEGMKLISTAKDNRHTTTYNIGENVRKSLDITSDGKTVNQLYAGNIEASASLYSIDPFDAVLKLEQFYEGNLVQSDESDVITVNGNATLSAALEKAVEDKPGVSIKATVSDTDGNVIIEKEIAYSETLEFKTIVTPVKDNRDAIYSITMDDGYLESTKYFNTWFDKYDLRGTGLYIANWMTNDFINYTLPMTEKGTLDIMSHTYTHDYNNMVANPYHETVDSQNFFQNTYPGQDIIAFGPGGTGDGLTWTDETEKYVREYYHVVRYGERGYNDLDLSDDDFIYNIKLQGVLGGSDNTWQSTNNRYDGETAASMNAWLDNTVANNKWLVEMWHSVCWPESEGSTTMKSDGGYRPIPIDISEDHLAYASKLQAEGKLWVATFNQAVKYIKSRMHSTIVDVATRESRTITLTHDLDKQIFNEQLTLKSEVPATWKYVKVIQDDMIQCTEVTEENGIYYAVYNAYVNEGNITLEAVDAPFDVNKITKLTINTPSNWKQSVPSMDAMEPVTFSVTAEPADADMSSVNWYVNGKKVNGANGSTFTFTPEEGGEYRVLARVNTVKSQFRPVNIKDLSALGFVLTDIKYKGATPSVPENTGNGTSFMYGDIDNPNMSYQHGWFDKIGDIPAALTGAKYFTTGGDFASGTGNYLEFTTTKPIIVVGMLEASAPASALVTNHGWSYYNNQSDMYKKYAYSRNGKWFTYLLYKEFPAGKVEIPYLGTTFWAQGGGFAVIENKAAIDDDTPDYVSGDVNGDGNVNSLDRATVARYIAKWSAYTTIDEKAADVNGDGKANTLDRAIISRHLAKWAGYETLPYTN